MLVRFTFKFKIIMVMLIALGFVSMIGISTYKQFSAIVSSISNDARPDMRLVASKSLMNELSDAENSVKSYSLTKDTLYLDLFYFAAKNTNKRLADLHRLVEEKNLANFQLDSLDTLIVQKFKILNQLLLSQDQFRVQAALDKVVIKLDKAINKVEKDESGKTLSEGKTDIVKSTKNSIKSEKKGALSWLFNKKNKSKKDDVNGIDIINLYEITKEVQRVKKEEGNIEASLKSIELYYIMADKKVTKKIKAILDQIESAELLEIAKQTEKAKITMKNTNQQIALFCIAITILLLFMSYIIIDYVRNNNRYRRALKKAKAEAEDHATTKENFLANMSHEIRTPMNAIAGFTEQIAEGPLNDEQREQLTMVRKSIEHLLYLINDVLDFTKLQAGKLNLEIIGFRPKEVINDVVTFIQPLAKDKELKLICNINTEDTLILLGDPFRLRQIILNIISNAIKFTEKGTISIHVNPVMQNGKNMWLRMELIDTGIGINEQALKKIFQEFEQADNSTSRNYGGTGLGLSIVDKLVKLHHGTIEFKSVPQKGTTVTVEIPYDIGTEKDIKLVEDEKLKTKSSIPSNTKILIVDDVEFNRKLLVSILKKYHVIYTEASNGKEAIEEIKRNNYDVILMDARMPELNGLEATKKIRLLPNITKRQIPIIALTAAVTENDRREYFNAGMNGFLAKPFKEHELLSEINKVLETKETIKITAKQDDQKQTLEDMVTKKINLTELRSISDGDQKFYNEMLQTFLDTTTKGFSDMQIALATKNWKMIAEFAHKISSPCHHLSAHVLYSYLKEIEAKCRNNEQLDTIEKLITIAEQEFELVADEVKNELNNQVKQ